MSFLERITYSMSDINKSREVQITLDFTYRRCEDQMRSAFWAFASGRTTFLQDFKKIGIK